MDAALWNLQPTTRRTEEIGGADCCEASNTLQSIDRALRAHVAQRRLHHLPASVHAICVAGHFKQMVVYPTSLTVAVDNTNTTASLRER